MSQAEIVGSKPAYIVSSVEIEREVPDWLKYAYKNAEAIQRVRELHEPFDTSKSWLSPDYGICCMACEANGMAVEYPCKTIKALDGDTE
jgi:hypothetical protein